MQKNFSYIEDFLGEKSTRFFSNGYKRTIRTITDMLITSSGIEAMCCVSVPKDWSMKGSARQAVHLSSIDALLIALQLSEAYCVILYSLTPSMRKAITIDSFSIKAGNTPLENLEGFKSSANLSSINGSLCSFVSQVGGMTIHLHLRLPFPYHPVFLPEEGINHATIAAVLGEPRNNFYGTGFSDVFHEIKDVTVDLNNSSVIAMIDSVFPKRMLYKGMETLFDDYASPIDAMVVISQLAQCYLYLLDDVSRANSSTLWMRAMSFSTFGPPVSDTSFARINVVRSERLLREEKPWRCINLKGYMGGMTIFYALGHVLPV